MLVLARRKGERICIGEGIYVKVIAAQGDRALIGIEAPPHVAVDREEVRRRKRTKERTTAPPEPVNYERDCQAAFAKLKA